MDEIEAALATIETGLVFANLVDFDTQYGHRNDPAGYAANLERFDARLATLLPRLAPRDLLIVTADHGNCEQMWDPVHNAPHTSHTLNLVEFFVVGEGYEKGKTKMREGGRLADIAPTVLQLMGLPKPAEMTGQSLIVS